MALERTFILVIRHHSTRYYTVRGYFTNGTSALRHYDLGVIFFVAVQHLVDSCVMAGDGHIYTLAGLQPFQAIFGYPSWTCRSERASPGCVATIEGRM